MQTEDDIHKRLVDLEHSIKQSQSEHLPIKKPIAANAVKFDREKEGLRADLQVLAGLGLIAVGGLMLLNHVKIGTGYIHILGLGSGGTGFLIVPVMVGIGIMFYDYKNKVGWILTAGGLVVLLFVLLSQLTMYFAHVSLLGFILMFLPLTAGAALLIKGMKVRSGLKDKAKLN